VERITAVCLDVYACCRCPWGHAFELELEDTASNIRFAGVLQNVCIRENGMTGKSHLISKSE